MEGTDLVNKKLVTALSGGAALVLALTGCGDNSEETDAWAKEVCDQVGPQVKKIQQANASINKASEQKKSPEAVQKTDSAAFQNISEAYKALASTIKDAGAPPVENGGKVQKGAVKELNTLAKKYGELKKTVDTMKTDDQAAFAAGLKGLAEKLGKLGDSGDESLRKLQSGQLREAMARQPGCKKPSSSAATHA